MFVDRICEYLKSKEKWWKSIVINDEAQELHIRESHQAAVEAASDKAIKEIAIYALNVALAV
ncbi:hypothetical protein O9992_29020 [Vibrio lentus]|nr:hypothetical protein [Vibrio lentus]